MFSSRSYSGCALCKICHVKIIKRLLLPVFIPVQTLQKACIQGKYRHLFFSGDLPNFKSIKLCFIRQQVIQSFKAPGPLVRESAETLPLSQATLLWKLFNTFTFQGAYWKLRGLYTGSGTKLGKGIRATSYYRYSNLLTWRNY